MNTSESKVSIAEAMNVLRQILGEYVWFVRCGEDRVLRLEFGKPHLTVHEPRSDMNVSDAALAALGRRVVLPTGRWHLFVEDGLWSIQTKYSKCSKFDKNYDNIDNCMNGIDGQKLISIKYVGDSSGWLFVFDISGQLLITDDIIAENECQWTVFNEDGSYLEYRNAKEIFYSS